KSIGLYLWRALTKPCDSASSRVSLAYCPSVSSNLCRMTDCRLATSKAEPPICGGETRRLCQWCGVLCVHAGSPTSAAGAAARCRGRPVAHRSVLRRLRHELRVEPRIRRIKGVHRSIDRPPQVVRLAVDETLAYAAAVRDVDLVARPDRDPTLHR